MRITGVGSAHPSHVYDQRTLTAFLEELWSSRPEVCRRLAALHANLAVEQRALAMPLEDYRDPSTFGQRNDAWIAAALEIGERAVRAALDRAGLVPSDVDAIISSTVTGVASPSIDARLVARLGLRPDVKRVPMFGLGCVAGAAAVSRAADYVRGRPGHVAVVLTVEICSLTLQRGDHSVANLISAGLFGDGAAAAVVVGDERAEGHGPRVVDTRSCFYPETEDAMGWHVSEEGFRIVLSPAVPAIARELVCGDVDAFLAAHGLERAAIEHWVCHPGGPKVLAALREGLGLAEEDLALAWRSLSRMGNLSSASVLSILEDTIEERAPREGSLGVMLAMGPGFCSELLLLRW